MRFPIRWTVFAAFACGLVAAAVAQTTLSIKPLAEKRADLLPAGALFWRIENFPSLADARRVAGALSLAAESDGKAWLFTLGPPGGASPGATRVAEVGPIARVEAAHYLLRINEASGAPGSTTPVHAHPGSEAFFVLHGEQSIRGPDGVQRVHADEPEPGHGPGMPMQVSSSGTTDLSALVMFLVDADKPFSSPSTLP